MTLNSFIDISSMAGLVLQGVLAVVLIDGKAWKRYPLFTVYSLFNFVGALTLYFLRPSGAIFFYGYWIGEAISIVLGFGVVYEVFRHLFAHHKAVLKHARLGLRWTFVVFFCVALSVVLVQAPVVSMRSGVLVFEEATRVVELGLLMFLFAASLALGLHWRQADFGIALGLGLFVAVELAVVALRSQIGLRTSLWDLLNVVRILAIDTSLLVWLGYLFGSEKVGGRARLEMS